MRMKGNGLMVGYKGEGRRRAQGEARPEKGRLAREKLISIGQQCEVDFMGPNQ